MIRPKAPETDDDLLPHSTQSMLRKLLKQELKRPIHEKQETNSTTLIGLFEGFDSEGWPIVTFIYDRKAFRQVARSTVELTHDHTGKNCLIQLCHGSGIPVVSGLIQPPLSEADKEKSAAICSDQRILLQCGDAFIELNAEGTIRIHGNYVESVAYGTNRLKGSSVKIN